MDALPVENQVIIVLGICLVSVFMINIVFKRFNLPSIIAPLIFGLILNFFIIEKLEFLNQFSNIVSIFANLGIILALFFIGLKVDFRFIRNLSKNSSIMALNAGLIPFELGFFVGYIYTRDILNSLIIGIALAITAEEVAISILDELKMLKRRLAQLIIEAGIVGDIFEIAAITLIGLFIKSKYLSQTLTIYSLLLELFAFVFIVLVTRYFLIPQLFKMIGRKASKIRYFALAFVVLFVMTGASSLLNFSYIIGALLAGLLLKDKLIQDKLYFEEHSIVESLELFIFGFFEPLIFISIGLTVNKILLFDNLELGIILTVVAIFGKLLGSIIGNIFCKETFKEGVLIGWALNARGATDIFAILIAKEQGLIGAGIFSAIVFMTIITTIISPIIFKLLVLSGYGIVKKSA